MYAHRAVLSVATMLAVICGLAGATSAQTKCLTLDQVKAKGEWDIVMELPDWEPYWFLDPSGKFTGMDVDLLNEVNKRLGIRGTRYKTVPWEGVLPALLSGQSDFLPVAVAITEQRKKTLGLSHPYGDMSVVIMTRPDTGIKATGDLVGRVVGAQSAAVGEVVTLKIQERLRGQGKNFRELKSYQAVSDALLDLGNRRLDAVLSARPPVAAYMRKHPGRFVVAGLADEPTLGAWAFRPADMAAGCIGDDINKLLVQLRRDGTLAELHRKWFGQALDLPRY